MSLNLTIHTKDQQREKQWSKEIQDVIQLFFNKFEGAIVLVDHSVPEIDSILKEIDRRGKIVFLVLTEQSSFPTLLLENSVDDIIVFPFRPLEIAGKLHFYERISVLQELTELNTSLSELIHRFQEDFDLVERLQKSKLPKRFPHIRGFKASSRYLAGLRSGGDYFDLAEARNQSCLSVILCRSSSYGLSNAVLSVLMRVVTKISLEQVGEKIGKQVSESVNGSGHSAIAEVFQRIYEEILLTLGEKDSLSLFYGVLHREKNILQYIHLGDGLAFYAPPSQGFRELPKQGDIMTRHSGGVTNFLKGQGVLQIDPMSRFVLISKGFVDEFTENSQIIEVLDRFRHQEAVDLLNELSYRVKSKLKDQGELPAQDCTAIVLDADAESRVLRLTKQEQDEN